MINIHCSEHEINTNMTDIQIQPTGLRIFMLPSSLNISSQDEPNSAIWRTTTTHLWYSLGMFIWNSTDRTQVKLLALINLKKDMKIILFSIFVDYSLTILMINSGLTSPFIIPIVRTWLWSTTKINPLSFDFLFCVWIMFVEFCREKVFFIIIPLWSLYSLKGINIYFSKLGVFLNVRHCSNRQSQTSLTRRIPIAKRNCIDKFTNLCRHRRCKPPNIFPWLEFFKYIYFPDSVL